MKKKIGAILLMVALVLALVVPAAPVAAATQNAVYDSHGGNIYPTGGTITEAVAAPDDGKFVQMDVESWIIMKFPGNWAAVPDGTSAADLQIDIYDALYSADAEIFVSLDGSTWTSMGVHADTANIDLDLNGTGPVKYVKVDQGNHNIDPTYPTLGFDLDAVVALNAGTLPYGEITSPDVDEVIFGSADFEALYYDDDPGIVQWAVRQETCTAGTNTVFGNVDGYHDSYTWDGHLFQATADTSGWMTTWYCFVFNPKEEGGEQDVRLTRHFYVGSLGDVTPTEDYNPVGDDHEVSVSIGVAVADVEVCFDIDGPNSSESGSTTTDEDGVASFTYTGNNPGTDTITAYIDLDANGLDEGDPTSTNTATKYWLEHYVTGGGNITEGKGKSAAKITFGGNVGYDLTGDEVGQWQCNFHSVNEPNAIGHFHSTKITSLAFDDITAYPDPDPPPADYNKATFRAMGRFNGVDGWKIRVRLIDIGEPGKGNDSIRIELWDTTNTLVYDSYDHGGAGGGDFPDEEGPGLRTKLDGGNFQIHPPEIPTMP